MTNKTDIVVYRGKGAMLDFLAQFLREEIDTARHGVRYVEAQAVLDGSAFHNARMFIMPGGESKYFCADLNGRGTRNIRSYIEGGGHYLSFCGGSYFSMAEIRYNEGRQGSVIEPRELALIKGQAIGPIDALGGAFDHTLQSARIAAIGLPNGRTAGMYIHGGPYFLIEDDPTAEVLGRYEELPGRPAAIVAKPVGLGFATLSGIHPEVSARRLDHHVAHDPQRETYAPMVRSLHETDSERQRFLTELFNRSGVRLKPQNAPAVIPGNWLFAPRPRMRRPLAASAYSGL